MRVLSVNTTVFFPSISDGVKSVFLRMMFKTKILALLTLINSVLYLKMVKKMMNQLPLRNVN